MIPSHPPRYRGRRAVGTRPTWSRSRLPALLFGATLLARCAQAADWPQWRGPDRNNISKETGLLKSWPEGGPKLVWKASGLGGGYTTPSIAGGRIFGMGYRDQDEVVWAADAATGKIIWTTRIAGVNREVGFNEGSRSTPTVAGGMLYTLGVSGTIVCIKVADGNLVWSRSLVRDFGGEIPGFGYSESPLVDGEKVIVSPGGKEASIVALQKGTGATLWKSQVPKGNQAAYASCIAAEVDGKKEYIQFLGGGVVGIDAQSGKFLWRYYGPANIMGASISTPIYQDNHVFAASGYQTGGGLAKLTTTSEGVTAKEVYFTPQMQNHHGGMVLVGDYLYGYNESLLTCLEFKTGKMQWENRSVGKGSLTYADGCLYVRGERGRMALVEATGKAYVEKSRFDQPERTGKSTWAHPVISNGRLYLRDQDVLYCYDIKGAGESK